MGIINNYNSHFIFKFFSTTLMQRNKFYYVFIKKRNPGGNQMKTISTESIKILTDEELSLVYGGSFLEGEIGGGKYIDIYRAGVTYVNCAFGSDEFYIGGTRISKQTADSIVRQSRELWSSKYQASGDLIGFSREWKIILFNDFGIIWDGKMGERRLQLF